MIVHLLVNYYTLRYLESMAVMDYGMYVCVFVRVSAVVWN